MAKTICFMAPKGGCGKSTSCTGFVAVLSRFLRRGRIVVIDAGGQPNTLLQLEGSAEYLPNVDTATADSPEQLSQIWAMDSPHVFRIIDLPGYGNSDEIARVLDRGDGQPGADLVIVPCLMSTFDVEAVVPWVQDALIPLGVPYSVLLGRVPPRALSEANDTLRQLDSYGINSFRATIRDYAAYRGSQAAHRVITEYGGKHDTARNAEDDMRALTREALAMIGSSIHIPTRFDEARGVER